MGTVACPEDLTLGPAALGCRGGFDFTLACEETVLSIIPSSLFIVLSTSRIWSLFLAESSARGWRLRTAKLVWTNDSILKLQDTGGLTRSDRYVQHFTVGSSFLYSSQARSREFERDCQQQLDPWHSSLLLSYYRSQCWKTGERQDQQTSRQTTKTRRCCLT